jgi:hypothetical protein
MLVCAGQQAFFHPTPLPLLESFAPFTLPLHRAPLAGPLTDMDSQTQQHS